MKEPLFAGQALCPESWDSVRLRVIFECCKWDIQSEDHSVLADFPLLLDEEEWNSLAVQAEKLTAEVLAAEQELLVRPDLHTRLGLPPSIRRVLQKCDPENLPRNAARVMRFDFHWTTDGWRISEVNADVPGGFIEASGFTELLAEHYPGYALPPNPASAYVEAIAEAAAQGASVALIHATAHSDDAQVMHYLARGLQRRGLQAILAGPGHLRWDAGVAQIASAFATEKPALLVRFFPGEWLPMLRPRSAWHPWFCGGRTVMSNPGTALLIQSKRFPLVWDELDTPLATWRSLLPEAKCPSGLSAFDSNWLVKPVFGRVGEDIAIAGVTEPQQFTALIARAKRHPSSWIAQRCFATTPLQTHLGQLYPCLGIFTVAGRAAGVYGRIAKKPLIDQDAQDIAVLLRGKAN